MIVFFKQKTAYEMRISDWRSDVCSSDLSPERVGREAAKGKQSGRTQEIQRLIARSLRSVCDMRLLGERQVTVDCDVLQADGGKIGRASCRERVCPSVSILVVLVSIKKK